ncbi:MAG: hypothetical protein IJ310_05335 [Clostridia bacterium]|nr:hypothetical protein [Clostridia bacterium]
MKFVEVGFSFFLIFLLAIILEEARLYFIYILFLIFHEFSHFAVAKKLGYLPSKIKLTFFGASLEGYDDFYFADEVKIVLAGPLFNFCVVVFCYLSFWFYPESFIFFNDVLDVNLAILLFNILPVFPLDFGRFLLAVFSLKNSRNIALKRVKMISFAVLIILFCVFLVMIFYGLSLSFGLAVVNLVSLHFSSVNGTSFKRNIYLFSKQKNLKKGLKERVVYVSESAEYFKLLSRLDNSSVTRFVFVDDDFNVVKTLSEFEIMREIGI